MSDHRRALFPREGETSFSPSLYLILFPSLARSYLRDLASRSFLLQHERTTCCSRAHLCLCGYSMRPPELPCAARAARALAILLSEYRIRGFLFLSLFLSLTVIGVCVCVCASPSPFSSPSSRSWRTVAAVSVARSSRSLAPSGELVLRVRHHAKRARTLLLPTSFLAPFALSLSRSARLTCVAFPILVSLRVFVCSDPRVSPRRVRCSFSVARALKGTHRVLPSAFLPLLFVSPHSPSSSILVSSFLVQLQPAALRDYRPFFLGARRRAARAARAPRKRSISFSLLDSPLRCTNRAPSSSSNAESRAALSDVTVSFFPRRPHVSFFNSLDLGCLRPSSCPSRRAQLVLHVYATHRALILPFPLPPLIFHPSSLFSLLQAFIFALTLVTLLALTNHPPRTTLCLSFIIHYTQFVPRRGRSLVSLVIRF